MKSSLLTIAFPRFCLGCGYVGFYICPHCEEEMKKIEKQLCLYCELPSRLGLTHPSCKRKGGVDGHIAIYRYDGLFKKILQEAKYKGAFQILIELGRVYGHIYLKDLFMIHRLFKPTVSAIPLHEKRIRERGFNQSKIIATHILEDLFPYQELLIRIKNTPHLANSKERGLRSKYINNAFSFAGGLPPSSALLIDDVVTTGSTLQECSRELKKNGVQTVLAFSLAKG